MCRTIGLRYSCKCQIDCRLSTCRGAFGTRDAFQDLDDYTKTNKAKCSSTPYIILRVSGLCGRCVVNEAKLEVETRKRSQVTIAEQARDRFFMAVAGGLGHKVELEAKADLDAATNEVERLNHRLQCIDSELGRRYPALYEDKTWSGPTHARSKMLQRGSLLRCEVDPEAILEDEASDFANVGGAAPATHSSAPWGADTWLEEEQGGEHSHDGQQGQLEDLVYTIPTREYLEEEIHTPKMPASGSATFASPNIHCPELHGGISYANFTKQWYLSLPPLLGLDDESSARA